MNQQARKNQVLAPEVTTIGMLGGGQLGRMFAFAAHRMGYRVHVLSPIPDSPAGQVANSETVADFEDRNALSAFAERVDVVTMEFENIPESSLEFLDFGHHVPVRPSSNVLRTTQHRIREKTALSKAGFPVTAFREVQSLQDLHDCFSGNAATHHFPAVLKTASWGYDGKGQSKINVKTEIDDAWYSLQCNHAILEAFVDFQCELSVIVARTVTGETACYEPIRNEHRNHILDLSFSPSGLPAALVTHAKRLASEIVNAFDVVGVMCVEMFLTVDQNLVVNELAPRPHNSGHLTMEAHATSQFEQQLRATCGLALGSTKQLRPAAMVNILGDAWENGQPDFAKIVGLPDTHLHLYGKSDARVGRKMGHITILSDDPADVLPKIEQVQTILASQNTGLNDPSKKISTASPNV